MEYIKCSISIGNMSFVLDLLKIFKKKIARKNNRFLLQCMYISTEPGEGNVYFTLGENYCKPIQLSGYFAILSSSWNIFAAIYYRGGMHNWNMREKYTAAFKFSSIDNDFWLIHLQNRTEQNRSLIKA